MAETLLDDVTGAPFAQHGDKALGASNVKIVGGSFDTSALSTEATQQLVLAAVNATVPSIPITQPTFLNGSAPAPVIDMVPVNITTSSAFTLEAADATLRWGVFAWVLSFTAACTLTIEGGAEDLVFDIPGACIWPLDYVGLAYCQTTANQALTITVSAGTAKGGIYAVKG